MLSSSFKTASSSSSSSTSARTVGIPIYTKVKKLSSNHPVMAMPSYVPPVVDKSSIDNKEIIDVLANRGTNKTLNGFTFSCSKEGMYQALAPFISKQKQFFEVLKKNR